MALEPTQAFTWGAGGARMTPEAIAAQRKVAQALMTQGMDYSPIQSPWQGAARVAQAMLGGLESGQADAAAKANSDAEAKLLSALLGGGAASSTTATPATSAAPMGATSIPVASGAVIPNDANAFPGQAGMDARLADASQDFIQDNPGTYLSSGVRSTADQARLYADRANNPNPVAAPGTSRHERGLAIDIGGMNADQRAMLPQYGLAQPVANDPPHVELAPNVQVASNDPAAIPANAQAAQGFAVPGQGATSPGVNPALVRAMASPYISDGTKKILGLVLNQQMTAAQKAADPLHALQVQEARTKLTPLGAPSLDEQGNLVQRDALGKVTVLKPAANAPSSVAEYNFYADQEAKAGRAPMPYGQWDSARKRAGATNVNTGTIPQGYEQYQDPVTGALRMRPIPGGPKDASAKDQAKADARATSTEVVTNAAKLAREAISGATLPATGTAGHLLSSIGETGAAELNRQVSVLKSNATIENLNAMRAQSPTGGALGNVTEGEGAMLAAKSGALDPRAPKAQFQRALDDYERTLLRIVHGKDAGDKIYEQTRPSKDGWSNVGGVKIRRKQ